MTLDEVIDQIEDRMKEAKAENDHLRLGRLNVKLAAARRQQKEEQKKSRKF